MENQTGDTNGDTEIAKRASFLAQVRDEQNQKAHPVKPDRAIKRLEMIVEIFQPQLSILRINGWAKRA